jgi:hypothetical protein
MNMRIIDGGKRGTEGVSFKDNFIIAHHKNICEELPLSLSGGSNPSSSPSGGENELPLVCFSQNPILSTFIACYSRGAVLYAYKKPNSR